MRFRKYNPLNEAYGQSSELDDFVSYSKNRFKTYYYVRLKLNTGATRDYNFRDESSALEFYNNIKEESLEDESYYTDAELSLHKVELVEDDSEEKFEYLAETEGE